MPLVEADLGAMAVVVGAGEHRLVWEYAPPGLGAGAAATVVGLVGCLLLAGRRRKVG